ncbi:hypothetical protein [Hymenobacter properus]|uniref:Uncharacterized protein n=1 Tax=Hymenobacter properus TaxID=2791026 RepID=A0A931BH10_9BACT|nr:hypothetical protein [Hymenobacter properus]MBF9142223.1 hypothetical protein [Hymenobacter properus]MBR7721030.1 hypothetical protein [Microvirga sp. SRT04]
MGLIAGSCQRQDPTQELTAQSSPQKVGENLVAAMAADEVVQAFYNANEQFLNADETYYNGLSDAGKEARRAELQDAFNSGADIPDPYRTPAQVATFHETQARRAALIRSRFPQFAQMSEDDQEKTKLQVLEALNKTMTSASSNGPGHAGYTGCSWYNYDHNATQVSHKACRAGYNGFMGYVSAPVRVGSPAVPKP